MKKLIGRTDIVDFPKLNLFEIGVKIDSGAYTSSMHCHHLEVENDVLKCQFWNINPKNPQETMIYFQNFSKKIVKSSNGIAEERFVIYTEILMFKELFLIELSLTERDDMRFPVLLGRRFIKKKFIIDVAKKNLSFKQRKIKKSQKKI